MLRDEIVNAARRTGCALGSADGGWTEEARGRVRDDTFVE
jgi:hypothetical protein